VVDSNIQTALPILHDKRSRSKEASQDERSRQSENCCRCQSTLGQGESSRKEEALTLKCFGFGVVALLVCASLLASAEEATRHKAPIMAEVLAASSPGDWRALDPENTLYVEFANGRVVIELAPAFAPKHVANVKALARERYTGKLWLVHCYGMVGAGRDNAPDSGGGTELYVVIGQAPRHLDRNVTLLGRVVQGMELLSALPRGTGAMGFYEKPEQRLPIKSIRVAADVPEEERSDVEIMRTDTATFRDLIESRRNRREDWFQVQAGHVEIGNVPVPARLRNTGASKK